MEYLQTRRNLFIESNPGLKETKTWPKMWRKLFEEGREALSASIHYVRRPTLENKIHLGEELADMVQIVFDMATHSGIDLEQALLKKLSKDELRFPPGSVMRRKDYKERKILLGERHSRFVRR